MSNEKRIRELTHIYLKEKYKGVTKDEFGTFLNVRADVLSISSKHIISVEVKSDKDNFTRLENQLNGYIGFSSGVYVALDEIHYEKYVKKYLENIAYKYYNVGILVYKNKTDDLEVKRPIGTYSKIAMLYKMLTSNELTEFFYYFKGKSKIPKDANTSTKIIETIFTYEEIYNISKAIFMNRFNNIQGYEKNLINDFDMKSILFEKWLDEDNWIMYKLNKNSKPKRSRLKCLSISE